MSPLPSRAPRGSVLARALAPRVPTEHEEQAEVIRWAETARHALPGLALLYAVPNGARRGKRERVQKKAEGMKAGVPDLVLPVARAGAHGLYLELKRTVGGRVAPTQRGWLDALALEGYRCAVAEGAAAAKAVLVAYLTGSALPEGAEAAWWAPAAPVPAVSDPAPSAAAVSKAAAACAPTPRPSRRSAA